MRIACVQSDVVFNDPAANLANAVRLIDQLAGEGVEMAVFPEAFLTGYCVECQSDAELISIPADHPVVLELQLKAESVGMTLIVGFAEAVGPTIANTAALIEPGQPMRFYRKTHLPELGLDKFVVPGVDLPVFETRHGKVGILICFDLRPPEAARVLALAGAELIVLPTNWPEGAQISAEHMAIVRAAENRVFLATCDRVGTENGFSFIGLSKIISPTGKVLASAGAGQEVITADIDLAEARVKRNVIVPGKFETTIVESRRPELYNVISVQET
jgi:predicted amidohydrolase